MKIQFAIGQSYPISVSSDLAWMEGFYLNVLDCST